MAVSAFVDLASVSVSVDELGVDFMNQFRSYFTSYEFSK
jgi:hypothetical protein